MLPATRQAIGESDAVRRRIAELERCCIGSRSAFRMLLKDRHALSDEDLRAIIERLAQVEQGQPESDLARRRREGREDDGSTGYM